jgi:type VI secretion system secreted protein Hcp
MATDIGLIIDGIKGESQIKEFKDKDGIDVLSWNWGMTQSGTTHQGSGAGGGKVSVNDITFTKYLDLSTPDLLKACTSGRHIPKAELIVRKAGGDKPVDYLKIEMNVILVSSYSTGGSSDGLDRVQETLSFNFKSFKVIYTQQNEQGSKVGDSDIGWDIAENRAL